MRHRGGASTRPSSSTSRGGSSASTARRTSPRATTSRAGFFETFYYEASDGRQNEESTANVSENPYFPVFRTSLGRIAIATCYDRHFEGVVSTLADSGAEIVFSPSVTFGAQARRMWDLEFPVDAARHRVFVGGSNRLGSEPPWNQEYFGRSYFCGPDGVLPDLSTDPELVISDLDLGQLGRPSGSGWDLRRDARPEIYGA